MVAAHLDNGGDISYDLASNARWDAEGCAAGKYLAFAVAAGLIGGGVAFVPSQWAIGSLVSGAMALYAAHRLRAAEQGHQAVYNAYLQREALRKQLGE